MVKTGGCRPILCGSCWLCRKLSEWRVPTTFMAVSHASCIFRPVQATRVLLDGPREGDALGHNTQTLSSSSVQDLNSQHQRASARWWCRLRSCCFSSLQFKGQLFDKVVGNRMPLVQYWTEEIRVHLTGALDISFQYLSHDSRRASWRGSCWRPVTRGGGLRLRLE